MSCCYVTFLVQVKPLKIYSWSSFFIITHMMLIGIADPSRMHDACHILTLYMG